MTFEQYWYGPPKLAKSYRDAQQLRAVRKNEELWMQGAYILEAIASVVSKLNGKSKGFDYPEKPHRITPLSSEEKAEKKQKASKQESQQVVDWLNSLQRNWEKKNGGNQQSNSGSTV